MIRQLPLMLALVLFVTACSTPAATPTPQSRTTPVFPPDFPRRELRQFAFDHDLGVFFQTLNRSGYLVPLFKEPNVTFFAPNDPAFERMDQAYRARVWQDPQALTQLMLAHVALEKLSVSDLQSKEFIRTADGKELQITVIEGTVFLGDAKIISAALESPLGVVYILDGVLAPAP